MFLTSNTPAIEVYVRNEFLYNQLRGFGEFTTGWLVSLRTVKGFAVTFTVLLDNGVLFTGLPIHAFTHKQVIRPNVDSPSLQDMQMWDCLSYDHSVVQFDFLKRMSCNVLLRDKTIRSGNYIFTVDFCNASTLNTLAETPNEWKMFHFIKLNDGNFCLYPQNRIIFKDASLTVPVDISNIASRVNTTEWLCETGDKWNVSTDNYMYVADEK